MIVANFQLGQKKNILSTKYANKRFYLSIFEKNISFQYGIIVNSKIQNIKKDERKIMHEVHRALSNKYMNYVISLFHVRNFQQFIFQDFFFLKIIFSSCHVIRL